MTCEIALDCPTNSKSLEGLLPEERERLLLGLAGKLHHSLCAADENLLGFETSQLSHSTENSKAFVGEGSRYFPGAFILEKRNSGDKT